MKDYPGYMQVDGNGEVIPEPFNPQKQVVWEHKQWQDMTLRLRPSSKEIPVVITENTRRRKIQNALDLFDEYARRKKPLTFGGWLRSQAEKEKITNTGP